MSNAVGITCNVICLNTFVLSSCVGSERIRVLEISVFFKVVFH